MPTEVALAKAQADGLNLVEVNPMSKPPVCKIMDYGRFKYEEKKKANETKKKQPGPCPSPDGGQGPPERLRPPKNPFKGRPTLPNNNRYGF